MKNKACVIIDNCMDCPYMCRAFISDGLDAWFCEYPDEEQLTVIVGEVSVDDEPHVEIPDWCPIIQSKGIIINTPKQFSLKHD